MLDFTSLNIGCSWSSVKWKRFLAENCCIKISLKRAINCFCSGHLRYFEAGQYQVLFPILLHIHQFSQIHWIKAFTHRQLAAIIHTVRDYRYISQDLPCNHRERESSDRAMNVVKADINVHDTAAVNHPNFIFATQFSTNPAYIQFHRLNFWGWQSSYSKTNLIHHTENKGFLNFLLSHCMICYE